MPEWLSGSFQPSEPLSVDLMVFRVSLALLLGFVVAGVYVLGLGRRKNDTPSLTTTLVLLSVLIALVTLVIGNSVARAFGLVGALSIVRFRTVVEDTRDTSFVIFAVVVGMAAGAGHALLAAVSIPIVTVAVLVMRLFSMPALEAVAASNLTIRLGLGHDPEKLLAGTFGTYLDQSTLVAAATARQGAAIELTYRVHLKKTAATIPFITDLNRLEGVQGVELKQG
ncbi:MAG: DUF4956 domain-containing protein [Planctomycetes bacterium]|nr:DUF4956 domain-containing protein [Planctomycetota bacterium]